MGPDIVRKMRIGRTHMGNNIGGAFWTPSVLHVSWV